MRPASLDDRESRRGRLRRIATASRRVRQPEVQVQLAALAIRQWDRLGPDDQARFRTLTDRDWAQLDERERSELLKLLERLRAKKLMRQAIHVLTGGA